MAKLNIIQCDACRFEDDNDNREGWSSFSYTLNAPNRLDMEATDLCPTCTAKMRSAIESVMRGAAPAADLPQLESIEAITSRHIIRTLPAVNWNKSRAAQVLGFERSTLDRKLKKMGATRPGEAAAQFAEGVRREMAR